MSNRTREHRPADRLRTELALETPPAHEAPPRTTATPVLAAEDLFQAVQVRAYYLWENAGRPHDEESRLRFWYAAENEQAAADARPGG